MTERIIWSGSGSGSPRLTTAQVATIAGVTPSTVRDWVARQHLHRDRRGLIDARELLAYLDRRGDRGQHRRITPPRPSQSPADPPHGC